jgi:DNA-binding transcriptional ArsR family regulator
MPARPLEAELRQQAPVFAALGDETRLRIVARLCGGEALSISRLAEREKVTRQAVTKHLHVLQGAGVVQGFRAGREQLWELKTQQLENARRCLDRIANQWDAALTRLKAHVENE